MEEEAPPALAPSLRLTVGRTVVIGPGKAQLLDLIGETGSIAAAGRRMGMSYKRAWSLVATMNRSFREPLVSVSRGGSEHGGAAVTELGASVLAAYRRLVAGIDRSTDTAFIRGSLDPNAGQDAPADEG